ncbi:eCIS core domain-containing protein [Rurimicrobium arvi]|uniref:eCIS core domain-containing protein n=1 Tax=Rurimicrobium arvi TaxID=2049916 RepID=A0ABP8MF48_9BACT
MIQALPPGVKIREHSRLAKLAARRLKVASVAMVIGNTIHLYGASRSEFLSNERWLRHELAHVAQYRRYGLLRFLLLYIIETMRHGYHNNRFEREARAAEKA